TTPDRDWSSDVCSSDLTHHTSSRPWPDPSAEPRVSVAANPPGTGTRSWYGPIGVPSQAYTPSGHADATIVSGANGSATTAVCQQIGRAPGRRGAQRAEA